MKAEVKEIGERGVIFQYEDENLVYLIKGEERLYLCDTHEGPESMKSVKNYIEKKGFQNKEMIIFNSHSDFDHNWGNCAFEDELIIGHKYNLERFKMRGQYDLEMKGRFQKGDVELVYPNLIFDRKISFIDDDIEFIYAPGHTICSSICIDKKDSVVYAGDLIEAPIPVILWDDLEQYISTLKYIRNLSVDTFIASHSGIVDLKLINDNIKYLRNLFEKNQIIFTGDEIAQKRHEANKKNLLMVIFESLARKKFGDEFDYHTFKINLWNELGVSYNDLKNEYKYLIETEEKELEKAFKNYYYNN